MFQSLRGTTSNLIVVDESAFVPHTIYPEILPHVMTDNGHILLSSSHKYDPNKKKCFLDINLLRSEEILVCNHLSVCPAHIKSVLESDATISSCICNLYCHPPHIHGNNKYRKLMNAFVSSISNKSDTSNEENNATVLLSEIGVIPTGVKIENVNRNCDLSAAKLATYGGYRKLCSELFPLEEYLSSDRYSGYVSREVFVFIDPAPTNSGSSMNAMSFVCRHERTDHDTSKISHTYVILAVEEFHTEWVDPRKDGSFALAKTVISTCAVITKLYGNYFTSFVLFPEANALSMDRFFYLCKDLYHSNIVLENSNVKILCNVIPLNTKSRDLERRAQRAKQHSTNSFLKKQKKDADENTLMLTGDIDEWGSKVSYKKMAYRSALHDLEEHEKNLESHVDTSYRVGYCLGSEKMSYVLNFYFNWYCDHSSTNTSVLCSNKIWSFWLINKRESIPSYIASKLETLELRPHNTGGKYSYKISGKKTSENSYICDDLPLSVILSVALCESVLNDKYDGNFIQMK